MARTPSPTSVASIPQINVTVAELPLDTQAPNEPNCDFKFLRFRSLMRRRKTIARQPAATRTSPNTYPTNTTIRSSPDCAHQGRTRAPRQTSRLVLHRCLSNFLDPLSTH